MGRSMADISREVAAKSPKCDCGAKLDGEIGHYGHSGGWDVSDYPVRQWLYVVCGRCGYQWALDKRPFRIARG